MENNIIITNEKLAKIKKVRQENPFSKTKFFTEKEFIEIYPYLVKKEAVEYIMTKYHVILEVALIYLDNIRKYNIDFLNDPSIILLKKIKKELLDQKLITENILMKEYLKKAHITLENIKFPNYLLERTKDLPNVFITKKETNNYLPTIYVLNNIEEEIAFVGEQIIKLIKKGIPKNKIFISNIPPNYRISLKRIMKQMHIPLSLKETTTLKETTLGTLLLKNIDNIEEFIKEITSEIKTDEDQILLDQIINICNEYIDSPFKNKWLTYHLKHTLKKQTKLLDSIEEVDFQTKEWKKDEYCFILSFNNEDIPHIYKNEEFLKDNLLSTLNIETSKEKNRMEKKEIINAIKRIPNCIITYKKNTLLKECYPSSLLEELKVETKKGHLTYTVSQKYNAYTLAILLDNYQKYGTITDELTLLYNNTTIPYQTYTHQYTKIKEEKIHQKLENTLHLSYTKLDTYNKCAFSYYLKHILKIIPFEDTFSMKIGKIIHKILEEYENSDFDYDKLFKEEQTKETYTTKEIFFLEQIKEIFRFTIDTLEERKKYTKLDRSLKEIEFKTTIQNKIPTTFTGIIDHLKYNKDKIISIIDYKTGTPQLDQTIMPLGFHLQLPSYLYLLKKDEYFKNCILGGFYLQPLFPGIKDKEKKATYEQTKKKNLKKIGFSNQDKKILEIIDPTYPDSLKIKGLKTKADGNFYQYAKLLDEEDINSLLKLVEENINEASTNILNSDFTINPKVIDNKNFIACEFCPLKDICYHEPKDNVYLTSDKTFLKKEENHGMDERTTIGN